MSPNSDAETEQAREETVEVLLAELERTMDKQFETIDGLDSKAGQLFGVASLVTALMSAALGLLYQKEHLVGLFPFWCVVGGFVVAILLYVSTIYCLIRAFRIEAYYLPMKIDREHIENTYLSLTKREAQEQLLANYIEHSQTNWAIVEDKARWVQTGLCLLGIDIVYLIMAIATGTVLVVS